MARKSHLMVHIVTEAKENDYLTEQLKKEMPVDENRKSSIIFLDD